MLEGHLLFNIYLMSFTLHCANACMLLWVEEVFILVGRDISSSYLWVIFKIFLSKWVGDTMWMYWFRSLSLNIFNIGWSPIRLSKAWVMDSGFYTAILFSVVKVTAMTFLPSVCRRLWVYIYILYIYIFILYIYNFFI